MSQQDFIGQRLDCILAEINHDINLLYVVPCVYTRNLVLNHLRDRIGMLVAIMRAMRQPQITEGTLPVFTPEQLARFDGKNGNPAYVAVNGIVYDVTNNAAWAAATHFGLAAGRDLTRAFAACHAGQPILNKLPVVGRLA